jgi:hypothetical protein
MASSNALGIVVEQIALDGVQQRLGEVVEIHPRRVADMLHHDLDGEVAPGGSRRPLLAHEFIDQGLVVFGLGGQAVDGDLDSLADLAGADLADADPVGGHAHDAGCIGFSLALPCIVPVLHACASSRHA